jgi:hypothetical protein
MGMYGSVCYLEHQSDASAMLCLFSSYFLC